ncbi:hypothetical protein IFT48_00425 [Pseudomonas fluorescens]|uniref:hypothetical protein n=1 Tax=Pseudomonas fluorescens TaxID=294 RepID=UPI001782956F|nr:hypothetical protein [Pseudomonas fluorescens]MBD8088455.1 hypothetical protein [Pseudomonas fluorescens]MBD8615098.1 hypothetical protein [Pseudomonas putida]
MPIGYRVVSFEIASQTAKTLMERKPVDLSIGSVHAYPGGVFLGTSRDFCQYYLGGTDDSDLILAFEFEEAHIARGDLTPNCEVLVKQAKLLSVEFEDEELARTYNHLFNPEAVQSRRASSRGDCLFDAEGPRRTSLIRAMDARSNHLNPMDFVYVTDGMAAHAAAKRVLRAYEEGERSRAGMDMVIRKALDHAVTTAVYEQEPQKVAFTNISNKMIYKAPNEGEWFFDSNKPQSVVTLLEVTADGQVSLAAPTREHGFQP